MPTENTTESTLNAWQGQLEAVRRQRLERGGGHAGLARPEQVQGKTGQEVMTAILEGDLPHSYMADTFDCELVELGDGLAIFQATPQLKHYNPLGSVHGGWYATLLDFALGCAVQTKLPAGRGYTTSRSTSTSCEPPTRRRARCAASAPPFMSVARSVRPKQGSWVLTASCTRMRPRLAPSSMRPRERAGFGGTAESLTASRNGGSRLAS